MSHRSNQPWLQIALLATCVSYGVIALLLPATWSWGTEWGTFATHATVIADAIFGLLTHNPTTWHLYWDWLNKNQLTWAFALHLGIPSLIAAAVGIAVSMRLLYVPGGREAAIHVGGPKLLSGKAAIRLARRFTSREVQSSKFNGVFLHPKVRIARQRELGNLLVSGQQGSGKSVVIKPIVAQILHRGDRALVYDQKREYTPLFLTGASALISPTDSRSMTWDIASDAYTKESAQLIANHLIYHTSQDQFWSDGARMILAGCMYSLTAERQSRWGWPELRDALVWPEDKLLSNLSRYYPRAARLVKESSKTTDGFLMTIASKLGWIETLATAWPDPTRNPFSVKKWLSKDGGPAMLIVPNDPQHRDVSGPLCAALLSLITANVLSMKDTEHKPIWLVLDEIANLPKCTELNKWLSLGRSKGARTIAGFQSFSQLQEVYGERTAETMLSLFTNVIALRSGAAGGGAAVTAKAFGNRLVEREVTTLNTLGQRSTTYQRCMEPVVMPEDLVHLPQGHTSGVTGFLSMAGCPSIFRMTWPFPKLARQAPHYVESSWLNQPKIRKARRRGRRS